MELNVCRFKELTIEQLYAILRLRVQVFVVEQQCPYEEIDNRDQASIHVFLEEDGEVIAYLRVLPKGVAFEDVAIGRVLSNERHHGYASQLLQEGLRIAKEELNADRVVLEAQVYAKGLYEKAGFQICSDEFLEDGIPHVKMVKAL